MAYINHIATAVPAHRHHQPQLLGFMQEAYRASETDKRKLAFLYRQSQIDQRYSVLPDFSMPKEEWTFFPNAETQVVPGIAERMNLYLKEIVPLATEAAEECLEGILPKEKITHLITISCTGLAAPGLDLLLMESLDLSPSVERSAINFMGCYAAVHGLKQAAYICAAEPDARVLVVSAELCTIHFQQEATEDNIASSLLFADGAAAVLISNEKSGPKPLELQGFYSYIDRKGKEDMAWTLGETGFLMRLSSYIPQLIEAQIDNLVSKALAKNGYQQNDVAHWCVHPGGKKILELIEQKLQLTETALEASRQVLRNYGNMSSPTVLFVLKEIVDKHMPAKGAPIFGAAFGPGLTMETFTAVVA